MRYPFHGRAISQCLDHYSRQRENPLPGVVMADKVVRKCSTGRGFLRNKQ